MKNVTMYIVKDLSEDGAQAWTPFGGSGPIASHSEALSARRLLERNLTWFQRLMDRLHGRDRRFVIEPVVVSVYERGDLTYED